MDSEDIKKLEECLDKAITLETKMKKVAFLLGYSPADYALACLAGIAAGDVVGARDQKQTIAEREEKTIAAYRVMMKLFRGLAADGHLRGGKNPL